MSPAEIEALVRGAWQDTLGMPPGEAGWEEAGGDSLATLHLVYRLESLLDRQLSFDLFQPDMTPAAMAAALAADDAGDAGGLPTVFLFPGVYGDGPSLALFRHELAGRVRFVLVEPPGFATSTRVLLDIDATAELLAVEVERRQPAGPLLLAGYSFGGSVAFAAAGALRRRGREVALTAVFDGALGATAGQAPTPLRFRHQVRHQLGRVLGRLAGWPAARVRAIAFADRHAPGRSLTWKRRLIRIYRSEARHRWNPRPLDMPVLLVLSTEFVDVSGPLWRRLCPDAVEVVLPAEHVDIFRGEALAMLCAAFETAITTACAPVRRLAG